MSEAGQEPTAAQDGRGGVMVPRWVKVFALVVLAVALLLLAHMVLGGGSHGPSLHGALAPIDVPAAIVDAGTASA